MEAAEENKKKPRKRVQTKSWEILTEEIALERLRIEEVERNNKKVPPKKAKASTSSGVSITQRTKRRPPVKVQGGTLETFISRRPISSLASSESDDQIGALEGASKESKPKKLVQKGLKDFFSRKRTMYKEIPTDISTSDHDSDDEVVTMPPEELIKKIKVGVRHVIFNREGSYFPGLVTKIKEIFNY